MMVELFVPALRLNLENTDMDTFATVVCQCVIHYADKKQTKVSQEALFLLQEALHETRKQVKVAFDRRAQILHCLRHLPPPAGDTRGLRRETYESGGLDRDFVLTDEEVAFFMSHKKKFCGSESQLAAYPGTKLISSSRAGKRTTTNTFVGWAC
jgi:hypothetical protein